MIAHDAFPAEPWAVRETALDLDLLAQTESIFALANGHLGLRGNLDEGEPRALSGTYLNGFYESFPLSYGERGYGFPEDGQAVVNVTDGKLIRALVEDEPLDVHRGRLESHERVLDLRSGLLERNLRWRSQAGRTVRVRSRRLVSFRQRSVAAISYEAEALEQPLRLALQSNLLANQPSGGGEQDPRGGTALGHVLESRLSVDDRLRVVLAHTTRRSGLGMAAGMDHVLESAEGVRTRVESEPDLGRVTISVQLTPGRPFRMIKLLAYGWSSRESIEWLRDQVDASLENALAEGFDRLADAQRRYLDAYWAVADVELDGDPEIQQALRFAQFQLLQASARAETRAIAAKGLTGPISPAARSSGATRRSTSPVVGRGSLGCAAPRSRGGRSTARSARATGPPGRRPSTSTRMPRGRSSATPSPRGTTASRPRSGSSSWWRRRGCGRASATTTPRGGFASPA